MSFTLSWAALRCTDVDEAAGKTGCNLQRSPSLLEVLGSSFLYYDFVLLAKIKLKVQYGFKREENVPLNELMVNVCL